MPKFDLKNIKTSTMDIAKEISKVEKNRIEEPEIKKEVSQVPVKKEEPKPKEKKAPEKKETEEKKNLTDEVKKKKPDKINVSSSAQTIMSVTLTPELGNYLRIAPKLKRITVIEFMNDLVTKKRKEFEKAGININEISEFTIMVPTTRNKDVKKKHVSIYIATEDYEWIKQAALYSGMNTSQFIENMLEENRK